MVYPLLVALELVLHLQAEADIFFYSQPWKQSRALEHHAAVRGWAGDFFVIYTQSTYSGGDEPGNQAQDGGFTAARGADQADELPAFHLQTDAAQSVGDFVLLHLGKALGNIVQF